MSEGGFIHRRHDEIKELFGHIANDIYHDVEIEPGLLPVSGEVLPPSANKQDDARLDLSVRSFWQRGERAFMDVRIFNPFASTHLNQNLENSFKSNEREKKRTYGQRVIEIEHGSFTPLVFSANGGCGREADHFISVLAEKLGEKQNTSYSETVTWLRAKISFSLLRSAILCIRGSRTVRQFDKSEISDIELTCSEAKLK